MAAFPFLTATESGVRLSVHAQPGARKNQIVGSHGEALKVKINAPPEDGRANAELIAFLAEVFGCAKSRISLVSGQSARAKTLAVHGVSLGQARELLTRWLPERSRGRVT